MSSEFSRALREPRMRSPLRSEMINETVKLDVSGDVTRCSPKHRPMTLELLHDLLTSRGWEHTASSLRQEANYSFPHSKVQGHERNRIGRSQSPNEPRVSSGSPTAREKEAAKEVQVVRSANLFDIVAPAMEETLQIRSATACGTQAEQRKRVGSLTTQFAAQNRQIQEMLSVMNRMRSASNMKGEIMEELEVTMRRKTSEIEELELIRKEHEGLTRTLKMELELFEKEVADLRRQLEDREDEEIRNRVQLSKLEEEMRKLTQEMNMCSKMTEARKIQTILTDWHDHEGHLQVLVRNLFLDIDTDRDGRLQWNNSEIRTFVRELFHRNDLLFPNWQEHVFYNMYRRCDVDHSYSLELEETSRFARSCFESALALILTGRSENNSDPVAFAEHWAKSHEGVPMARSAMTYSSGVIVDFLDYAQTFKPVIAANQVHRLRMVRILETGEHLRSTMRTYRECDKDGNGRLTWNNGEIRNFISACFRQHGLIPPDEEQLYFMYTKFDKDKSHSLEMRECLEMVDALFRSTFVVEIQGGITSHATQATILSSGETSRSAVRQASPIAGYPKVLTVKQVGQVGNVTPPASPRPGPAVMRLQSNPSPRSSSSSAAATKVLLKDSVFDALNTSHSSQDGVDRDESYRAVSAKIVDNGTGGQRFSPVRVLTTASAPMEASSEAPRIQVLTSEGTRQASSSNNAFQTSPSQNRPASTHHSQSLAISAPASQANSYVSSPGIRQSGSHGSQANSYVSNPSIKQTMVVKSISAPNPTGIFHSGGGSLVVNSITPRASTVTSPRQVLTVRPGRSTVR